MRPLTNSKVPRKMTRISQKIRLEGLKTRLRSFPRNILSPKAERDDSVSEDGRYDKYCAIYKAKGGPFWTHDTEDCRTLAGFNNIRNVLVNVTIGCQ